MEILGTLFSNPGAPIPPDAEALALKVHCGPLLYWFSVQREVPVSPELHRTFKGALSVQMTNEIALKKLFRRLEQENIPFVPIKGIDLAFRVFPIAALRLFSDWDIWIKRADHKRFCDLLKQDNWLCPTDCPSDHHWGDWVKDRFLLEPHFTLPNFSGVPVRELWSHVEDPTESESWKHLSGSFNMVLLFQHNAGTTFQWSRLLKLLIDVEFLLRTGTVDWTQVTRIVRKWHLPHPGLLLAAFPEFFRDRWSTGMTFPEEIVSALRTQLLSEQVLQSEMGKLNAVAARPLDPSWIRARLQHLRRNILQLRYPQMGPGKLSYFRCLCLDVYRKIRWQIFGSRSDEVKAVMRRKKLIENSWRYGDRE